MELLEILNKVLENNGYSKVLEITDDMDLKNDIGYDSFMLAELTVEIEEVYNIDIFKDSLVFTIGDIKYIDLVYVVTFSWNGTREEHAFDKEEVIIRIKILNGLNSSNSGVTLG
jgi:acyl carrier protein